MSPRAASLSLALALALGAVRAHAAPPRVTPPVHAEVRAPRIALIDLVPDAPADVAAVDMGAAPAPGGSRLFVRAELAAAFRDHNVTPPRFLPEAVRVTRRARVLDAAALDRVVRGALAAQGMPRGATLTSVRAPRVTVVADGYDRAVAELPRPPRRTGAFNTNAAVRFERGGVVVARISVPVALALSADAAVPDAAHNATLQLIVRRGLVDVTTSGTAGIDANIDDVLPVTIHPSGRVLRARLIDSSHALALEEP